MIINRFNVLFTTQMLKLSQPFQHPMLDTCKQTSFYSLGIKSSERVDFFLCTNPFLCTHCPCTQLTTDMALHHQLLFDIHYQKINSFLAHLINHPLGWVSEIELVKLVLKIKELDLCWLIDLVFMSRCTLCLLLCFHPWNLCIVCIH